MSVLRQISIVLTGSVALFAWANTANAADLLLSPVPIEEQDTGLLPAVSAVNGKWELDIGYLSDPSSATFRAAGSISLPIGERFGLQGDVAVFNSGLGLVYGGAVHAFTRDPSSYLLGVTGGIVRSEGATLAALGLEGELYMDRLSLEGWAGYAAIDYDDVLVPDDEGFFAIGDLAYYPDDNLRLAIGASTMLGYNTLRLSSEWQFTDLGTPLSLTGNLRLGESGTVTASIGLKGYFGGNDDTKSLIDRHRQDDPTNKVVDMYGASGDALYVEADEPESDPIPDNETACFAYSTDEYPDWVWIGTSETEGTCEPLDDVD